MLTELNVPEVQSTLLVSIPSRLRLTTGDGDPSPLVPKRICLGDRGEIRKFTCGLELRRLLFTIERDSDGARAVVGCAADLNITSSC